MKEQDYKTVIVADGTFPVHDVPLRYLKCAERIICCDGSADNLLNAGYIPDAIIGDMDSLSEELANRFTDRIIRDECQDTNDLTKAVMWCHEKSYNNIVIIGATGKREDHTIGNISLLAEYAKLINVRMVTDTGIFLPLLNSSDIESFPGQQISLFSLDPDIEITSKGLKYPLNNLKVNNWWVATLNEAVDESFSLKFTDGRLIVYMSFPDQPNTP
jgi:thiamine pyrophosphokinase